VAAAGTWRISKSATTYSTSPNQPITYTICIFNRSGGQVVIQDIQDNFPLEWRWAPVPCGSDTPGVDCSPPLGLNGGGVTWASTPGPITINDNQQLNLTVSGSYTAPDSSGQPWCNRYGAEFIVNVISGPAPVVDPVAACVVIQ
jgi:hypothetical protein